MAARLVQNIFDDYLSCPICFMKFSEPRKLPCDHTFCTDCIQKHIDNSLRQRSDFLYFNCPLCRTEISQPRRTVDVNCWATYFPVDNLIQDLLGTLSIHERQLTSQQGSSEKQSLHNKCKVHLKNDLDVFCLHHLSLICSKCAKIDHSSRKCEIFNFEEAHKKVKPRVEDLRKQLYKQALKVRTCGQVDEEFHRQRTKALKDVDNLEDILEKFHERCAQQLAIQRRDIEKLNREHIEERKDFYSLAVSLLETENKVENLYETADKKVVLSELSFITKQVEENDDVLRRLSSTVSISNVSFTINKELHGFLNSFTVVGFVDESSSSSILDDFKLHPDQPKLPSSLKGILNRRESGQAMGQTGGKLTTKLKFSGKLPQEERCWLIKILALPDSSICVLDKENASLKRFSSRGEHITKLSLVDIPYSMALLKPSNEIVITKPEKEILEFVTTDSNHLSVRKYIHTHKKYFGICQVSAQAMAVSSWSQRCVDIIDEHGLVLTTISEDFEIPDMLCCNGNAEITVIDKGNRLVCFQQTGQMKWVARCDYIMNNLTVLENGQIYICCKDAKKICSVNSNSPEKKTILAHDIEDRKPLDICNENSQILIVLENGDIEIMV
ncbi:tripartite motif containing 13-like [Mytilus californianus]|uniref:tripartite motif containing 13-like n=1 Tax=Mytilus californianus TaxID=6549 RepID=UPI002245E278|nr:tripartite motif containing 13-like [Mytilus californianus]